MAKKKSTPRAAEGEKPARGPKKTAHPSVKGNATAPGKPSQRRGAESATPPSEEELRDRVEASIVTILGQGRTYREIKRALKLQGAGLSDDQIVHVLATLALAGRIKPSESGAHFELAAVPARPSRIAAEPVAALFALDSGRPQLSDLDSDIVRLCNGGKTCSQIFDELKDKYPDDAAAGTIGIRCRTLCNNG